MPQLELGWGGVLQWARREGWDLGLGARVSGLPCPGKQGWKTTVGIWRAQSSPVSCPGKEAPWAACCPHARHRIHSFILSCVCGVVLQGWVFILIFCLFNGRQWRWIDFSWHSAGTEVRFEPGSGFQPCTQHVLLHDLLPKRFGPWVETVQYWMHLTTSWCGSFSLISIDSTFANQQPTERGFLTW